MQTILITGSNGFIGSNIVKQLSVNYRIIECGTKPYASNKNKNRYIQWHIGYENEPETLQNTRIHTIIHAAAATPHNSTNKNIIQSNCTGTLQIAECAKQHAVRNVIYISGLTVVGHNHTVPITEDTPVHPSTTYQATKAAGEAIINQLSTDNIRPIILRVPSPIGPRMPEHTILPVFIKDVLLHENIKIQGKGTRKQNYLDVRDMAYAIEKILQNDQIQGIYNIGANNIISNLELAKLCNRTLNGNSVITHTGKPDPDDHTDWTTKDEKLRKIIGNYQKITLQQSIIDIANQILL